MKQIWEENFNDLYRNFEDMQNHCEYLENENNKLQSNWNSLREWLFSEYVKKQHTEEDNLIRISLLLDKMNELEGKDNN